MGKYATIFRVSLSQEFAYRVSFIMWRFRNVFQIFLIFFMWDAVFSNPQRIIFGYDRTKILTYVFGLLIMRSLVLSSRSVDIAGDISQGRLSNYLVKPVSYFKYWFTRDLSSKFLNLAFASVEVSVLLYLLRPPFFLQTDFIQIGLFIVATVIAMLLFFLLIFLFSMFVFWYPEQAWGSSFLLFIFIDFLGGGIFPIDILPFAIQRIIYMTPFPYLLFMPLQIYLDKFDLITGIYSVTIGLFWIIILGIVVKYVWRVGLKNYKSEGR